MRKVQDDAPGVATGPALDRREFVAAGLALAAASLLPRVAVAAARQQPREIRDAVERILLRGVRAPESALRDQ